MSKINSNDLLLCMLKIYKKATFKKVDRATLNIKLKRMFALYLLQRKKEEKQSLCRKYWVHPIFSLENRKRHGASDNLVKELYFHKDDKFINYFRMNVETYEKLLSAVGQYIIKQDCVREAIPSNTRLQICLRYLASGDSMKSLSYAYRVGHNAISKIVLETCEAIWIALKDQLFPQPTKDWWKKIAKNFEENWNFPNCIGAIDGKHVVIQAPPNSGSAYYNYKGQHSINLFALCDARYRFTFLDIGAEGRQSDGGVFRNSKLYALLEENSLEVPLPEAVGDKGPVLPYVIVADEAFALKNYMMRPYSRNQNLDKRKKIFNYRLSRARRVIESTFGILVARWRIYRKPIISSLKLGLNIIKATCCLHNFIISCEGKHKYYSTLKPNDVHVVSDGLCDSTGQRYYPCTNVANIRNTFAAYFEGDGAIPWQWEKALQNEF